MSYRHPTPEACRKVAAMFQSVCDDYGDTFKLLMSQDKIKPIWDPELEDAPTVANACGTIACHAGAYWLAKKGIDAYYNDFELGEKAMAKDLGFHEKRDLLDWAGDNSWVWGNIDGRFMFLSDEAFPARHGPHVTLPEIAEHWRTVADRLEALRSDGPLQETLQAIRNQRKGTPS